MNSSKFFMIFCVFALTLPSCVSKKKFLAVQDDLSKVQKDLGDCGVDLNSYMNQLQACQQEKDRAANNLKGAQDNLRLREEQISDLKDQITDIRSQRDAQLDQVEGLTELSQSATKNIEETLSQLGKQGSLYSSFTSS